MAGVLWWLVMSFNLFLLVAVKVDMRPLNWMDWLRDLLRLRGFFKLEALYICYHVFCWVPPIFALIIAVSNEKLGYGDDLWYFCLSFFL